MGRDDLLKLRREGGHWIVTHNDREIDFKTSRMAAFEYLFIMKDFVRHKVLVKNVAPVRSLVPHPKKIRMTKKWRERISRIKADYIAGVGLE